MDAITTDSHLYTAAELKRGIVMNMIISKP